MNNATMTVRMARDLQSRMADAGFEVTLPQAWALSRVAQVAALRVSEELRAKARAEREQRGMVARWCADMRSVGAWDGE